MSALTPILNSARQQMDRAIDNTRKEFSGVRSGKASPTMLDTVRVEMYGQQMPLNQVASVSAPEPRMLIVTPFDKGQIKAVEKAIRESDLGLDPAVQGNIVRVPLPSMNEQRRKDLVKIVHKYAEEGRVAVRHARTEARDRVKKTDGVPEDDKKHFEKDIQKVHDDAIKKIDELIKAKEAEIMEV
ncbi:MAG: ribosome recycling factor [Gemmatimonadaceae bacterium]|nr:ribosome recycling factor [Gemmatimonadaceae bacterium]NUQ92705.1 ribosome recycling factor [Gemmatimonadaceae bacterium]NUR20680.1 ribosome recycling factor [Gemmatimonadaceae bacterium]NUS97314.1 ribosome recycling factor [Gemmatimonadaceae bacterium]